MKNLILVFVSFLFLSISGCKQYGRKNGETRNLVDTIGYAHTPKQMDSIVARIDRMQAEKLKNSKVFLNTTVGAKAVLCPHDDYSYVGWLYPATLQNIKAKTVIIFSVAHKAKKLSLENKLIFDSYSYWNGPFGKIKVSPMRMEIIEQLPTDFYQVNDSIQAIEHSVEAMIPYLQYYNRKVQIVSILVPYMSYKRMKEIGLALAAALQKIAKSKHLQWNKDFAFVFSSDAVHYGDMDWGGKNFAYYGTNCTSYVETKTHELEIMHSIAGRITPAGIHKFTQFTVRDDDYRKYKWTWCGRYSLPLGLQTAYYLNQKMGNEPLRGTVIGYGSSLTNKPVPVKDLGLGVTAPAYDHHWVGYAAIRYD